MKQLLRILVKALESFSDITLIEAIVMCLTRLQPLLRAESPIHKALFWVSISILQLDEIALYASGLALLEQNLLTLESQGAFDLDSVSSTMLSTRDPLEWYFKQLDHSVGLSFKANFHFALVGHLIKGYRHASQVTVSRTTRILSMLLDIVAKPTGRDKYEVTKDNVAYLAALVSVSEEVRSRCHVRHTFMDILPDSPTFDSFAVDNHLKQNQHAAAAAAAAAAAIRRPNSQMDPSSPPSSSGYHQQHGHPPPNQRQKSLELMEQPPQEMLNSATGGKSNEAGPSGSTLALGATSSGGNKLEKRSNSIPVRNNYSPHVQSPHYGLPNTDGGDNKAEADEGIIIPSHSNTAADTSDACNEEESCVFKLPGVAAGMAKMAVVTSEEEEEEDEEEEDQEDEDVILDDEDEDPRPSISNENNILLDPEVLNDQVIQVLVLTVMATLVKYTTDESEVRILYEYLAEASVVFPRVFPVIHSLLDAKITNVLSLCHDKSILAAVQSIIENMIACEDKSQQQLHYLQTCGFGGLWRFAGPFTQATCNAENVELFLNTLEALVETCLPGDEQEENISYNSLLSVSSNIKMSSSLTSLSLASPTEKTPGTSSGAGPAAAAAAAAGAQGGSGNAAVGTSGQGAPGAVPSGSVGNPF